MNEYRLGEYIAANSIELEQEIIELLQSYDDSVIETELALEDYEIFC